MDLNELREALDEIRPDEASDSLSILMTKVGQMAEGGIKMRNAPDDAIPSEAKEAHRRDLLAGTIIACFEYAAEHDVDVEQAIEERIERMREMKEKREAVENAIENGDAAALAEALGSDANEVPTGMFGDEDDDEDLRGFA